MKSIRKQVSTSPGTHCDILPLICSDVLMKSQLHKRSLGFYSTNIFSPNVLVRLCTSHMIQHSTSNASKSIAAIAEVCHTNKDTAIKEVKKYKSLL